MKKVSVLVPSYNEQDSINYFFDKVKIIQQKYERKHDIRIIFLNNCSTDKTLEKIKSTTGLQN